MILNLLYRYLMVNDRKEFREDGHHGSIVTEKDMYVENTRNNISWLNPSLYAIQILLFQYWL